MTEIGRCNVNLDAGEAVLRVFALAQPSVTRSFDFAQNRLWGTRFLFVLNL